MQTESPVAEQFEDAPQQREAATLGMWLFLGTEILFFGAMFLGYTVYRTSYPVAFREASEHTLIAFGSVNTAILLLSSFVMAQAVHAAESRMRFRAFALLALTAILGITFLVIKGFEYAREIHEGLLPGRNFQYPGADPRLAQMFFYIYFLMTGIHALHVAIGVGLLGIFSVRTLISSRVGQLSTAIDLLGLYWHFVDVVWVFLFPLLYLAGRHS